MPRYAMATMPLPLLMPYFFRHAAADAAFDAAFDFAYRRYFFPLLFHYFHYV